MNILPKASLPVKLSCLDDQVRDFIGQAKAPSTLRAYRSDWVNFAVWCDGHGRACLPALPETVALYVTDQASTKAASTITRRLAAISVAHQAAGHDSPISASSVRAVMQGIRRVKGTAPKQKTAAITADIRAMIGALPLGTPAGVRDRALLLVGFAGALRRSELAGLDAGDVQFVHEGLAVTIRRSKGDQEGQGQKVGLPFGSDPATCPVRALQAWLDASEIADGPLFRAVDRHGRLGMGRLSGEAVAAVVKRAAAAAGKDPGQYAGHSLRAGLATAAAQAGVEERDIMTQGRWRSLVVRRYIRDGSLFRANAAARVGL